jgi:hypothetical protein
MGNIYGMSLYMQLGHIFLSSFTLLLHILFSCEQISISVLTGNIKSCIRSFSWVVNTCSKISRHLNLDGLFMLLKIESSCLLRDIFAHTCLCLLYSVYHFVEFAMVMSVLLNCI